MTPRDSSWTTDRSPRLYVEAPLVQGGAVTLSAKQSHYLRNVLRLAPGAVVRLFNGRDGEWRAVAEELGKKTGCLRCEQQSRPQDTLPDLHFLFAPLKQARLDYLVQKATEAGAGVLRPVRTRFTMVARLKRERLQANVVEAAEQCNLLCVPQVEELADLTAVLDGWDPSRRLVYCDEAAPVTSALATLRRVERGPLAVLIGPEGGFAPEERDRLRAADYVVPISLGPRVMRADTAAVAALTLVQATLGDWQ